MSDYRTGRKLTADAVFEAFRHAYIGWDAAFDEVVSAWDAPLLCQTIRCPRPCRNPAAWLAIHHGPHGEIAVCTFHKNWWLGKVLRTIGELGSFRCATCNLTFTNPDQCTTFRTL